MSLPFRLGATSYVIPAGLVENALRLRDLVDDIELVLFDTPHGSNLPDAETVARLRDAAGDTLTFSLHLPTHLRLTARHIGLRARHLDEAQALLDRCAPLPLSAVVLHLEGDEPVGGSEREWEEWRGAAFASLATLLPDCPAPLCIENIERYPIEAALPVVEALGVALCLDVGHCWKVGRDPLPLLQRELHRTPIAHLHGWDGERDHQSLTVMAPEAVAPLLVMLQQHGWGGILTLELFENDFWTARDWLLRLWERVAGAREPRSRPDEPGG